MTLEQLQAKARADLTARPTGVLLEWSMMVADAAGRVREAQAHLDHLEYLQRDFRSSLLSGFPPSDERVERFEKYMVTPQQMDEARKWLGETVAVHRACELVLSLLERPRVKKALTVLPGGKTAAK